MTPSGIEPATFRRATNPYREERGRCCFMKMAKCLNFQRLTSSEELLPYGVSVVGILYQKVGNLW
jgi:hypothetical protein